MIRYDNQMARQVLIVLIGAIVLYLTVLTFTPKPTTEPTLTLMQLQSKATSLEETLSTTYVALVQAYLAEGDLLRASEAVSHGLLFDPNNLNLLRLDADIRSNY